MSYKKVLILGVFLAACGGEETPATGPVAPIAPGTPTAPGQVPAPGAAPGVAPTTPSAPAAGAAQTRTGSLGIGDQTLESGEYLESHTFTWNAGETHTLRLTSTDFDPYLIVRPPNGGQQLDNDDLNTAEGTDAGLTVVCQATGVYTVVATSFASGETGAYTLTVQ